ncbi:MAG: ThiF family adenylyltransferase [Micromonosporaceae bacterium]
MKLILLPALRRLLRHRSAVQLGTDPGRATVVEFTDPRHIGMLDLLDGTRTAGRAALDAARFGLGHAEALRVIELLRQAGVLTDPAALSPADLPEGARRLLASEAGALSLRARPDDRTPAQLLRRRHAASVLVSGYGRLAAAVATMLGAAGVGHIELAVTGRVTGADLAVGGLRPADLGRPRAIAAADAVRRAAPHTTVGPLHGTTPELAILVGAPRPDPVTALRYARRHCPHLTVWFRDGSVVLGPLVRPRLSSCLDCLDLHRQDRDPQWPLLARQLATCPDREEPAEAGLVGFAAGLAAMQALCHLDGGVPDTVGGTLELTVPGRIRRRNWAPHPRCGCVRRATGLRRTGSEAGGTMAE